MPEFISNLFNDPTFWVAISTVLCFGFIASKAAKPLVASLDNRTAMIASRLAEAEALRNEAAALLEDFQRKANEAMQEAEATMLNAQRRADQMRIDMEADLKESISRQEQNAKNRIARLEEEAMQIVKSTIIGEALDKVRTHVANDTAPPSIDSAMTDLKKILQK